MITLTSGAARLFVAIVALLSPLLLLGQSTHAGHATGPIENHAAQRAIVFAENIGQWDASVRYQGTSGSTSIRFEGRRVSYLYAVDSSERRGAGGATGYTLSTDFVGAREEATVEGDRASGSIFNYYLGADRSLWHTGARGFEGVRYHNLYPGIDAHYYGNGGRLKYDFIIAAGADHRAIELRYNGARNLTLTPNGEMAVATDFGSVREAAPFAYQTIGGRRVRVAAHYRLLGGMAYGFEVGEHDARYPVVIDPCLSVEYATYLGGGGFDEVTSMAVDSSGNSYAIGFTRAPDFPVLPKEELEQLNYVFISKLSKDGTQLLYSTVIAQSYAGPYGMTFFNGQPSTLLYESIGEDVEVTPGGEAVVALNTNIDSMPTTSGVYKRRRTPNNINSRCGPPLFANYDCYVVRLNGSGGLVWGTYLGGSDNDYVTDIALDPSGNVFLTGMTYAPSCGAGDALSFPTTVPRDRFGSTDTLRGFETFVAKLNSDGRTLPFSAIYGGTRDEFASRIGIDASGEIYLLGSTNSTDLPTTPNARQRTAQAGLAGSVYDLYIARINPTTAQLDYSSYFADGGGAGRRGLGVGVFTKRIDVSMLAGFELQQHRQGLVVEGNGTVVFGGSTRSTSLQTTPGAVQGSPSNPAADSTGYNVYVVRMNLNNNQVLGATYLGGSNLDALGGLAINKLGEIVVGISTASADFPITPINIQSRLLGRVDAVVASLTPDASRLTYATYYGGTFLSGTVLWEQTVSGITADREGGLYLYGGTASRDLPITGGAVVKENDYYGGYIVKFAAPSAAKIGLGLNATFEPNQCGDLQTQTQLLFNSGQLPMQVTDLRFKVGEYFQLINPPKVPFTLDPCDTLSLTIGFLGADLECKTRATDSLIVTAPNAAEPRAAMYAVGRRLCQTFHFDTNNVVIDYYKLHSDKFVGFGINVRGDSAQYLTIVPDPGNSGIFTPVSPVINRVYGQGTTGIAFNVNATDTGYYCESFTATVEPCHRVTKLSICAHVRSGIFTAVPQVDYGLISCKEIVEPFVVHNTGNDTLQVSVAYVGGPNASDINFVDNVQAVRKVQAGDSTIFDVYVRPIGAGKHQAIVVFQTDEGGDGGKQHWIYFTEELDSVAIKLTTASVIGGFGEIVNLPVDYQPILDGRVPLEELTLYAKFDPKMLDIVGVNQTGTVAPGWELVENKYVDSGAVIKLRKGTNGAPITGAGRLMNLQLKVLRGDTIASPLDLLLAGASKGCLNADIDSGRVFQLNAECAATLRLLYSDRRLLKQSIPNPALTSVTIPYRIPEPSHVTLVIYDALGRESLRLIDGNLGAGDAQLTFDTRLLAPGTYYYRITVGDNLVETRTMVIER